MLALNIKSFNEILSGRTDKTITRVTPTIEKLIRYRESLLSMKKELQSKNISKKDRYNKARVLGRFKSLNNKLKPRNKEGRELKEEVSSLIREIEMLVGTPK
jgi:seryl-tRNA synthetase